MASRKLEVQIVGDASGLQRAFNQSSGSAGSWGGRMAKAGKVAALGLAGATGLIAVGLKKSVDAALEAEKAQTRLDSAFKAANVSAKDRVAAMKEISDVSQKAALDDEDLSDSFSKLVRTSGSAKSAMEGMSLAADIARARHISLEAATKMVEKAMIGSEAAFKRVGIAAEKGTSSTELLEMAQKKFAGSAEAYGNSAAGSQEKFQVALENLQETIGTKFLPVLAKMMSALTELIAWASANWPKFQAAATNAYNAVRDAAQQLINYYNTNFKPAVENVVAAVTAIWQRFGGTITTVVVTAFNQLKAVVTAAFTIIRAVFETFAALLRGDWSKAWDGIKTIVSTVLNLIVTTIRNFGTIAKAAMSAAAGLIYDGLKAGVGKLDDVIRGALNSVIAGIKGLAGAAGNAAASFGKAIYNGIVGALRGLGSALKDLIIAPINYIIGKINSIRIPGFSVDLPGPIPDINFGGVDPIPNIPTLAKGGIVKSPTLAMIGEAGPEAVVPLPKGKGAGMGMTFNLNINAPVYGPGGIQELARQLEVAVQRATSRNG